MDRSPGVDSRAGVLHRTLCIIWSGVLEWSLVVKSQSGIVWSRILE